MSGTITMPLADRVEVRDRDVSFVAIKTITVRNEYGKDEMLKAGVTFIHDARHFLVATYPHLFQRTGAPRELVPPRNAPDVRRWRPHGPSPRRRHGSRWLGSTRGPHPPSPPT